MELFRNNPPRKFSVKDLEFQDCGKVKLNENELISLITDSKKELDITKKSWGFYATPSMNARLKNEGFKTALVKSTVGRVYIMVVDSEKIQEFLDYLQKDHQVVIEWLDEHPSDD